MPRYSSTFPAQILVRTVTVPGVATGSDLESPLGAAPFDGYISQVRYFAAAAYTGAATNFRRFQVRNKFTGTGVTVVATVDGVGGTNLAALTPATIALAATVPTAPAYSVQPTVTPSLAPVLSNGAGSLTAGLYEVAYSYVVNGVESELSPYAVNVQGGSNGIAVAALTLPQGVSGSTAVKYYFLVSPGTAGFVVAGSGAAITLNNQGNGTLPTRFSVMDVTQGDSIAFNSVHVGTGLADPGGVVEITFQRS